MTTSRSLTCLCLALLLAPPQLRAGSPGDAEILKKTFSSVEASGIDDKLAAHLEAQWKMLGDRDLQAKVRQLTPEVEKAAVLRLRVKGITAKVAEAKGK